MANKTVAATLDANDTAPGYVVALGRDPNGVLRPLTVNTAGSQGGGANPAGDGAVDTGTPTQVASSASAVTILAANAARAGATIVNDSTAILYLILSSTTPTSSVYTVALAAKGTVGAYYEVPFGYTGIIKGIWASANGNAVVTEFS